IEGFTNSDIFLFKECVSRLRDFVVEESIINKVEYKLVFQDFYGGNSPPYHAFTRDQLINVKNISAELPISNHLSDIQNSYIAIGPDSIKTILDPLVKLHNGVVVDVDNVYRQYSYGVLSPYGIKAFLQDVYYRNKNLKYVLIGLQNNYYFNNSDSFFDTNYIPSMQIIAKEYGAVISDYWYACLDDDSFPEITIGRFPASNKKELEQIVNKTINHINRNMETWDNNVLFIGGLEKDFKDQSELLLRGWVDRGHFISRLYIDISSERTSFYGSTDSLLNYLNRGLSYINFVGHGGGAVWGDRSLLGHSDIDNISNTHKIPFVTSMTCFTGDYSNPFSLGREMLLTETGGALAWYGSAGKGWIGNDYLLIDPLNKILYSSEDYTIGEMINLSKIRYFVSHNDITRRAKTQLFQYNLIGDPAIKLKRQITGNPTVTSSNPEAGEQIQVDFETSSVDSIYYQFFLDDYYSLNQPSYVGQANNLLYDLPDTLSKGNHRLNIGYKSGSNLLHYSVLLAVEGSKIENIEIIPENPTYKDSIGINTKVSDKNGIDSVQVWLGNNYWADLVNVAGDLFELKKLIPPQPAGTSISINIRVVDGNGNETLSPSKLVSIYRIPNIFPNNLYFSADEVISLVSEIENSTPSPSNVKVKLHIYKNNNWDTIEEKNINFDGKEIKYINFDGYFPNGENQYRLITNISDSLSNTKDDTLILILPTEYFWVTNNLGTTADGTNHSVVGNEKVKVNINPGVVEQSKIITIRYKNDLSIPSQPDFSLVEYDTTNNAIEILWNSPSKYEVNWKLLEPIVEPISLYKYYNDYSTWLPQTFTSLSNNTVQFTNEGSGEYAFLTNTDFEPPVINATVNGQKYLTNSYINDSPIFSFSIYDNNGIDFRLDSMNILINGKPVVDVVTNINGGAGNLGVELSPVLLETDSTLSIIMQDAAGNESDSMNLKFIVSKELTLIDYGNYPNPFIDNTKFAYELSETVEELSFIIYSVEGRKVHKLSSDESLTELDLRFGGYHELDWNGFNDTGTIVGNGTYFYLIRAKNGKNVIEKTGKIVRAK
ncbi:MAG: C25 family cysteine peptidase, partial [Candidatus Neomarinimicrobiota bacterium]